MLLKLYSKAIDIYILRGGEDSNVKKIKSDKRFKGILL